MSYVIIRFFAPSKHDGYSEVIKTGLTLEEAQDHCKRDDTHVVGEWFDGYDEEK